MSRRNRKNDSENKSENMVLTMTISLFIILLAFFILMNSIAVTDARKKRALVGSLLESFGGEAESEPKGEVADESFSLGVSPLDLSDLSNEGKTGMKDIRVTVKSNMTIISIPVESVFITEKTEISPEGEKILGDLTGVIEKNPYAMDISVHTDNRPVYENTDLTAIELTTLRSVKVLQFFVEKAGIPSERFTACGWGKEKPQEPNTTIEGRAINRRIDLAFMHSKKIEKPKNYFIFRDFFFRVKETKAGKEQ